MDSRPPPSRRDFLKAAGAALAAGTGCLVNARTELPARAGLRRPFRFVHLSGLRLSFAGGWTSRRRAMRAAERVRDLPEIDALLLGGDLIAGTDAFDFVLLEEFILAAGLPWFAVPGATDRHPRGAAGAVFRRRMEAMGALAFETPWEASPSEGVRLVGLDAGPGPAGDAGTVQAQVPFLTGVLDRFPDDAVIVSIHRSPRLPGGGGRALESELLRFVLEAAPNVKMVLSGASALPFVKDEAGLLYVGTPALSGPPHLFREVTLAGNGAVFRDRGAGPAGDGAAGLEGRRVYALR